MLGFGMPAMAQTPTPAVSGGVVVATCGTPPTGYPTTGIGAATIDTTGTLCTVSGGGGGSSNVNLQKINGTTINAQSLGAATLSTAGSGQVIDNFNYYGDGTPMLSTDTGKVSIASGQVASGAIASGAVASGAIASGAFAAGSLNSAIPDPCTTSAKLPYVVNIASATTTVVVAASASNKFRACSMFLFASAAENVALVEDATGSCASPDAGMMGGTTTGSGINLAANQGWTLGNGLGTVAQTASTNVNVCLITSSSAQLSGVIMGVLQP